MTAAPVGDAPETRVRRGPLSRFRQLPLWTPLSVRNFRLVWVGESVSVLGDQFYFIALAWLTLQLTNSAVALGTVLIVTEIPRAVLLLFGGAIADRVSPRLVMLGSNAIRGVLVGLLAILVFSNRTQLWELYVLSFLFGSIGAFFYPAFDSIAPILLVEERLSAGNSLLQGSSQLANLLGPVLAGIVIATLGATTGNGSAFAVDAVSFAIATLALLAMRGGGRPVPQADPEEAISAPQIGLLGSIMEGIRYAWSDPLLRVLLFAMMAANLVISGPVEIGLATVAHSRFSSAAAYGLMMGAFGLGALAGAIVAGSLGTLRHRGYLLIGLCVLFSSGMVVIGLTVNVAVDLLVLVALGLGNGFIGVALMTWIQARTAPELLGRIMSLFALAGVGLVPLSLAAAGIIAQVSVTLLFVLAGSSMGAVTIAVAASRTLRQFE